MVEALRSLIIMLILDIIQFENNNELLYCIKRFWVDIIHITVKNKNKLEIS